MKRRLMRGRRSGGRRGRNEYELVGMALDTFVWYGKVSGFCGSKRLFFRLISFGSCS